LFGIRLQGLIPMTFTVCWQWRLPYVNRVWMTNHTWINVPCTLFLLSLWLGHPDSPLVYCIDLWNTMDTITVDEGTCSTQHYCISIWWSARF
jgi:hypothetical protein